MQKIIFSLLVIVLVSCKESNKESDKIKTNISNLKTGKHINIPGTRIFIVPPPGFEVSKTFVGLKKGDSSIINIYDMVGGNYFTSTSTFNKDHFEKQGAKVFDYQEIKVDGYPAKYISIQGDPIAKGYGLVFGDTTFSAMIMASYPLNDEATAKQIVTSLNTVYYDKNKKVNPFETAFFSLDDKSSRFKFAQYSANLYVYTVGGEKNKANTPEDPVMLVTQFPMNNTVSLKTIADQMMARASQYGLANPEVKNISTEKINGYDAYEANLYGQIQGKNSVIYYCIIANKEKAVTVHGIVKKDLEPTLAEIKALAHTLKIL